MENINWDKIKSLGTIEGLINYALEIEYFVIKDANRFDVYDKHDKYFDPFIEAMYQSPFINEVKFNIRNLNPNESAYYLKPIIDFLYTTDIISIGANYINAKSFTNIVKTDREVFSDLVDKDGKIEFDVKYFQLALHRLYLSLQFILNSLTDIEKEIKTELKKEIQNIDANSRPRKGFLNSLDPDQIENLFQQLKGRFIDRETKQEHFKAIFKDEPLPDDFIPIKRTGQFSGALCAYFIYESFQEDNPNDYWNIAENCFDAKNLKQSFYNAYNNNASKKPNGYDKIDVILKNIYHPFQ